MLETLDLGTFKFNIDGTTFFDQQATGMKTILRDNNGEIILTVNIYEKGFRDLATIECLIMFKVLQLYFNLVIHPIVIEFDCQTSIG